MPGPAKTAWGALKGWPLLFGLAVLLALHAWRIKTGIDLQVYLRAGGRALSGEELYVAAESSPFKYAPPVALLFAPLSLLPARAAQLLWLVASAVAYAGFVRLEGRARGLDAWWQPLAVLALAAPYLSQVFFLGQADAVLVWLMALSELDAKRAPLRSGVLWAVVCAFKLPFLLFALVAAGFREWRRLAGLALGLAGVAAVGALRFGAGGLVREVVAWRELLAVSTPVSLVAVDNQSLTAMLCSAGVEPSPLLGVLSAALGAVLVAGAALAVRAQWRRDAAQARLLAGALAFFLAAFLSPLGWQSNLVVIAPVACALLALRAQRAARAGLGVLAAVLLLNYDLLGREHFELVLRLKLFGWATLLAAGCLILATRAPTSPLPANAGRGSG